MMLGAQAEVLIPFRFQSISDVRALGGSGYLSGHCEFVIGTRPYGIKNHGIILIGKRRTYEAGSYQLLNKAAIAYR